MKWEFCDLSFFVLPAYDTPYDLPVPLCGFEFCSMSLLGGRINKFRMYSYMFLQILAFVQGIDSSATVNVSEIQYTFNTSADGMISSKSNLVFTILLQSLGIISELGFAESLVVVYINNTNIVEDEYLRRVNTMTISSLSATSSEIIEG